MLLGVPMHSKQGGWYLFAKVWQAPLSNTLFNQASFYALIMIVFSSQFGREALETINRLGEKLIFLRITIFIF